MMSVSFFSAHMSFLILKFQFLCHLSLTARIHVGKVIGTILFGPIGLIGGFLVDRYFERMARKLYSEYNSKVPGIIDSKVEQLIQKNLPKSGEKSAALYFLSIHVYNLSY